jgi:hypothetical protein
VREITLVKKDGGRGVWIAKEGVLSSRALSAFYTALTQIINIFIYSSNRNFF